jgi:2-dehydro-3-deoxyphosphogluconate aldolase/(4S)-4-hydroxy-2-oxoglutarate aldolase
MYSTERQAQTLTLMRAAGILPVLTIDSVDEGIATANALQAGGLTAVEVTMRTPVALAAIRAIRDAMPQFAVGVGTVLTPEHADAAIAHGASFIVTPGTPDALARYLAGVSVPVIPGAATATEVIALMAYGFRAMKLFPATAVGGLPLLRGLAGPLGEVMFCPTGGVNENNAAEFLREPNIACVGGSWMVNREWIRAGDYARVEASTAACRKIIDSVRAAV